MSYILDALKRSEQERHQDKMPSFSAENMILQTNQKKSHWWPYVLIIVHIINALALYFLNRDTSVDQAIQSSSSEPKLQEIKQPKETKPSPSSVSSSNRRAPPANVLKERKYIQPIKQVSAVASSKEWRSANNDANRADDHLYGTTINEGLLIKPKSTATMPAKHSSQVLNEPMNEERQLDEPVKITPLYKQEENIYINPSPIKKSVNEANINTNSFEDIPLLTSLDKSFQRSIPQLTFNSHIYSDKQSQRRVMINNFYLKEGQSFDGLELLEIGEAFIQLSKDNTIFKIPVLRDWDGV